MMRFLGLVTLAFLSGTWAYAHSKMGASMPADGETLTSAPTKIVLNFSDKLRLTKVEASHSGGDMQDFDLGDHTSFTESFTLPMEPMGAGTYEVEWRGLGIDGHSMQGSFSFKVE